MGEDRRYSIPLVFRLDRLDSMMIYIEGKQESSRWSSHSLSSVVRVERQCKPLEMAMREAYSKGSLLDRVASLEDRLVQLCLEIESSNISNSKPKKTYGHGSKRVPSCSLPTFNNPNPGFKQHSVETNRFEFQGNPHRLQQKLKQPSSTIEQQHGNKDGKKPKSGKKGAPFTWPHLRILGC